MVYEKTEVEGFYRDTTTGAIVNNDTGQYSIYKKQKQFYREFENMKSAIQGMQQQITQLQQTVDRLTQKVNDK